MSITAATYAQTGAREGFFARLFAPVTALYAGYQETKALVAANLLTHDDSTLHMLGYNRADLKRGIVRSVRAD